MACLKPFLHGMSGAKDQAFALLRTKWRIRPITSPSSAGRTQNSPSFASGRGSRSIARTPSSRQAASSGAGSAAAVQQALTAHTGNKNNPHAVTAEQVGALASSGGVMSGAISMSGHKIANLAAPADSTDAANKQYVDEHAGARVILGSYVGTGKTGKSNPNQITLAEPFKILCIYGMQSNNYYKSIDGYGNGETSNIIHSSIIPTEYTKGISFGFGYRYSSRDSYGKKSTDGKTFSWYFDLTTPDATSEQLNASGTVYYYYAIV